MRLREIIWKDRFIDKLEDKHGVFTDEVEEIIFGKPHILRAGKGHIKGKDLYVAYGKTEGGRYLVVFFIRKEKLAALPISARDMTKSERNIMNGKNKIDEIPEEFGSYEEAAEFWDNHDTTDYLDEFETVEADVKLKKRRFEIEIDADLMPDLSKKAHNKGVQVSRLVSDLIRDKINSF